MTTRSAILPTPILVCTLQFQLIKTLRASRNPSRGPNGKLHEWNRRDIFLTPPDLLIQFDASEERCAMIPELETNGQQKRNTTPWSFRLAPLQFRCSPKGWGSPPDGRSISSSLHQQDEGPIHLPPYKLAICGTGASRGISTCQQSTFRAGRTQQWIRSSEN